MNLQDFRALEAKLGHPPTAKEVLQYEARPMLKAAHVKFLDSKYNYVTSVNGKLSNAEIVKYFKNNWFNLGHINDDMQKCIACDIKDSTVIGLN